MSVALASPLMYLKECLASWLAGMELGCCQSLLIPLHMLLDPVLFRRAEMSRNNPHRLRS